MELHKILVATVLIALVGVVAASCNKERSFSVEGKLTGEAPDSVRLERLSEDGSWIEVKAVPADDAGKFNINFAAPDVPDLFRIGVNDKYVYLPVDSTETFTLTAPAADISHGFKLAGSPQAEAMTAFETEFLKIEKYNNPDSTEAFKRRVFNRWLKEAKGNIFSYYVLTRQMGNGFFIEYTDPIYRAVATSFQTYKPNDPHTPLLAENARWGVGEDRRRKGKQTQMEATLSGIIDITLPDINGEEVSLSSVAGKGKPTVLVFGALTMPETSAANIELRKLYDTGLVDIYEVCLDADRFAWKRAALNLPWTAVLDTEGLQGKAAIAYNIFNAKTLPVYFIFNKEGDLIQSATDMKELPSLIN
ncbi:MAG: peroxiredoxin family protein [Prevotella sp.]|nr:peroxiredoxin family protein [Prevotella sp.]MCM1074226.1 peroxiredoxin family protein [Ruminococcus sp.]